MAGHGLGGADGHLVSGLTEGILDCLGLADITDWRRGSVSIDVIDFGRGNLGMLHGNLHAAAGSFALGARRGHVIGIGGGAIADKLAINTGPTLLGVFEFFKDNDACAFAHDEPIAILVEGTGGLLWLVVPGAECTHAGESSHTERCDGGLGSTGNEGVGIAKLDDAPSLTNGIIGRGACGDDRHVRTAEPVLHGDQSASHIADDHRDGEGRELGWSLLDESARFVLQTLESPNTASHDDPEAFLIGLLKIEPRVIQRKLGAGHGKLGKPVGTAGILGSVEPLRWLEAPDLTGDQAVKADRVERVISGDTRAAFGKVFPEGFKIVSDGTDDSDTGNDNSAFAHKKDSPKNGVWKVNLSGTPLATMEKG